jgi:hypothetical protein
MTARSILDLLSVARNLASRRPTQRRQSDGPPEDSTQVEEG